MLFGECVFLRLVTVLLYCSLEPLSIFIFKNKLKMILQNFDFDNLYVIITDTNKGIFHTPLDETIRIRLSQEKLPIKTELRLDLKSPILIIEANPKGKWYDIRIATGNKIEIPKIKERLVFGTQLEILNLQFCAIREIN